MSILIALVVIIAVVILGLVVFTARTARKVEAALPPRGRFMQIDAERIHYVDRGGTGPAIVMIHGLGGNLMHFTYALADELSSNFRVIMVDRPGCGYSERPDRAPADLTAQAATLAKFVRGLALKQPLVVGHSLGGALSLAIALDHPDCVGALALIAPLTHVPDKVPDVFKGLIIRSPTLRKAIAWTLATPLGIRRGAEALKEVFGPEPAPSDFPVRAGGLLGLRPRAFCSASSDAVLANHVLPIGTYPETNGSFTNFKGRVQRITQAFPPPGNALTGLEAIARLSHAIDGKERPTDASAIFNEMAASEAPFEAMNFDALMPHGLPLK